MQINKSSFVGSIEYMEQAFNCYLKRYFINISFRQI